MVGQLALAHAVHDAKVHDLGLLAADPRDVRHHLVQVHILRVVPLDDVIDHRMPDSVRKARGPMDQQPRLLRRIVVRPPAASFLGQKQSTDQGLDLWVTGRDLLEVWTRRREPARHRAAIVAPQLVELAVDAALVLVLEDRVDERAIRLVELPQTNQHLAGLVRVGVEILLGE